MNEEIIRALSAELKITEDQVRNTLEMLSQGDTVPFIARYRKEQTKGLDEEQILVIQKQYDYQLKLAERKEDVIRLISEQGKLTDEIKAAVLSCTKLSQVEDIYRPYMQKKKTRAAVAIKAGLQGLADYMLSLPQEGSVEQEAEKYINEEIKDVPAAIQGAEDIIAETVSDNAAQRWNFKDRILKTGTIVTKKKKDAEDEKEVYRNYYDYSERLTTLADHRVMAIDRAEKEKVITVSLEYDRDLLKERAVSALTGSKKSISGKYLKAAAEDGCDRLLFPSIEREIRSDFSERAQAASIEIFSENLEKLLLQPPLLGRVILGFDPGFYNGCKLAVIDGTGRMLATDKIYPFRGRNAESFTSKRKLLELIKKYDVKLIAIGNGTASRESEQLVAELIRENSLDVSYAIVSEAGASVWSAQEAARKEFPDMAVEERSAVSIARRLLDPLAELIKIDPKSIGVGQYQHDLPQKALSSRLDEAVMKCVNRTGADLNTASPELLTHISGLNSSIAGEIVSYRNENGRFRNRKELLKVKKLGPKAFKQCAGFLRITDGDEPLDMTAIHPESYESARALMKACGISRLGQQDAVFPSEITKDLGIDPYTLTDIESAIRSPLRDYREQFDGALLRSDILDIKDLHIGDKLSGTVRNVVNFGAFVDIGLHDDGLVHVSRMSEKLNINPMDVVSVGDIVDVWVFDIDEERGRISLSLLPPEKLKERNERRKNGNRNKKGRGRPEPKKEEKDLNNSLKALQAKFKSL